MKPKRIIPIALESVLLMPPRPHYTKLRSFSIFDSGVVKELVRDPGVLNWLFDTMRGRRLIVYDSATGTWRGRDWKGRL